MIKVGVPSKSLCTHFKANDATQCHASFKGYYAAVHELFHHIGSSLSIMVIAVVAGLEIFHTCPDWTARGICNSALARLVFENEKIFLEEDQLAAIWNLFFSINSIPLISKIFPDRIVIIKVSS